jgi:hypothetical protein
MLNKIRRRIQNLRATKKPRNGCKVGAAISELKRHHANKAGMEMSFVISLHCGYMALDNSQAAQCMAGKVLDSASLLKEYPMLDKAGRISFQLGICHKW